MLIEDAIEMDRLRAQRDELLVALEGVLREYDRPTGYRAKEFHMALRTAREAWAKAKGE